MKERSKSKFAKNSHQQELFWELTVIVTHAATKMSFLDAEFNVTYFAIEDGFFGQSIANVINIIAVRRIIRLSKHLNVA